MFLAQLRADCGSPKMPSGSRPGSIMPLTRPDKPEGPNSGATPGETGAGKPTLLRVLLRRTNPPPAPGRRALLASPARALSSSRVPCDRVVGDLTSPARGEYMSRSESCCDIPPMPSHMESSRSMAGEGSAPHRGELRLTPSAQRGERRPAEGGCAHRPSFGESLLRLRAKPPCPGTGASPAVPGGLKSPPKLKEDAEEARRGDCRVWLGSRMLPCGVTMLALVGAAQLPAPAKAGAGTPTLRSLRRNDFFPRPLAPEFPLPCAALVAACDIADGNRCDGGTVGGPPVLPAFVLGGWPALPNAAKVECWAGGARFFAGERSCPGAFPVFLMAAIAAAFPPLPFSQSTHTQLVVHRIPAAKQSQYFFLHFEFLQRQPVIILTEPRGVVTSWPWISRLVPLNALVLLMRILRTASIRCASWLPSLWQSVQKHAVEQRTSVRKHWQYCFRHLVRPHRHPLWSLP